MVEDIDTIEECKDEMDMDDMIEDEPISSHYQIHSLCANSFRNSTSTPSQHYRSNAAKSLTPSSSYLSSKHSEDFNDYDSNDDDKFGTPHSPVADEGQGSRKSHEFIEKA